MSTEIVKATPVHGGGGALSLGEMNLRDARQFCESLAETPLLPDAYRNRPASVLWAMEYGRALGLDVVTTITTIHVIKGKPTQSADLMLSRTRAAGHKVRIRQEPGQCTVSIWRSDDPDYENAITWTYDDAVTAGLCELRNNRPYSRSQKGEPQAWEKYPRAMLRARAISECVRTTCPEVLHGAIYTPEELGARVDGEGLPMEAEVQQLRVVQANEPDPWATPAPQPQTAAQGRDYLNEAREAADAETVRQIYREAAQDGAVQEYLAQIAAVGKEKATAEHPASPNAEEDVTDAEIVPDEEADHAAAVAELRAAAEAANLTDFEKGAYGALGCSVEDASANAIRALAAQIRNAA